MEINEVLINDIQCARDNIIAEMTVIKSVGDEDTYRRLEHAMTAWMMQSGELIRNELNVDERQLFELESKVTQKYINKISNEKILREIRRTGTCSTRYKLNKSRESSQDLMVLLAFHSKKFMYRKLTTRDGVQYKCNIYIDILEDVHNNVTINIDITK